MLLDQLVSNNAGLVLLAGHFGDRPRPAVPALRIGVSGQVAYWRNVIDIDHPRAGGYRILIALSKTNNGIS